MYTCDLIDHNTPVFQLPFSDNKKWSRGELWAHDAISQTIHFVHGDSLSLAKTIKAQLKPDEKIDMVYIDGEHTEPAVITDYNNLKSFFSDKTILIFDDCDPRFPGVERAVMKIAHQKKTKTQLIHFWPSIYTVAIGNQVTLNSLKKYRNYFFQPNRNFSTSFMRHYDFFYTL